jgi:Family of unknown function (DUF6228)
MSVLAGDAADESGVVVRCRDNPSVSLRFCDRYRVDPDCVHYAVELRAPGLAARVDEVVAWTRDRDLPSFLDELAADFRGWDGERTWCTNDRDVAVSTVFRSGGRIGLMWSLRPWPVAAGGWSAAVTIWVEAGEQMAALASDVRHFLFLAGDHAGERP